ncbi:MAG: acetaldehyde dehydrogenase (acetylating), partial [Steroidobacteraceae bacterium]
MGKKINAALIGSGNIGTDLMVKALRSAEINPVWMVGIDPASDGLAKARERGLKTTDQGVDGLLPHLREDDIRIAFDATSAYVHHDNARKLREAGVVVIDLTPDAIGPFWVPAVYLAEHAGRREMNV